MTPETLFPLGKILNPHTIQFYIDGLWNVSESIFYHFKTISTAAPNAIHMNRSFIQNKNLADKFFNPTVLNQYL